MKPQKPQTSGADRAWQAWAAVLLSLLTPTVAEDAPAAMSSSESKSRKPLSAESKTVQRGPSTKSKPKRKESKK